MTLVNDKTIFKAFFVELWPFCIFVLLQTNSNIDWDGIKGSVSNKGRIKGECSIADYHKIISHWHGRQVCLWNPYMQIHSDNAKMSAADIQPLLNALDEHEKKVKTDYIQLKLRINKDSQTTMKLRIRGALLSAKTTFATSSNSTSVLLLGNRQ